MAVGLEVRVPFCNHRLVEYVYNVPWSMKTTGRIEKGLLRSAVADLLPSEVAQRPKSVYPGIRSPAYDQAISTRMHQVLTPPDVPLFQLVDPSQDHGHAGGRRVAGPAAKVMPVWRYHRCPFRRHDGRVRSHTEGTEPSSDTLAVHGGERRPGPEGSVVYPIYQGTVFEVEPGTGYHDIRYIRLNTTPSQSYLHDKLAALEHAEAALATSSGMAAVTTILHSVLRAGDHLLASDCLYGGTHEFLTHRAEELGWTYTLIDPGAPHTWEQARTAQTKAFLVETITNPLMRVGRLREVAAFSRRHAITTIIDNTFASPVNFRPLTTGFDLCFHSATKYLNGHSDIVAGAIVGNTGMIDRVRHSLNLYGGSLDPHAGFLLARGLKTLSLRMRAHNANAAAVAEFLHAHHKVTQVNYPGLPTHPDHAHAAALLTGFGGMLSFRLAGGTDAAAGLLDAVRLPYIAPSLGGVETLMTRPATTSHAGLTPEDRDRIGITDDLIRMSCGIEAAEDLIDDLDQALAKL